MLGLIILNLDKILIFLSLASIIPTDHFILIKLCVMVLFIKVFIVQVHIAKCQTIG